MKTIIALVLLLSIPAHILSDVLSDNLAILSKSLDTLSEALQGKQPSRPIDGKPVNPNPVTLQYRTILLAQEQQIIDAFTDAGKLIISSYEGAFGSDKNNSYQDIQKAFIQAVDHTIIPDFLTRTDDIVYNLLVTKMASDTQLKQITAVERLNLTNNFQTALQRGRDNYTLLLQRQKDALLDAQLVDESENPIPSLREQVIQEIAAKIQPAGSNPNLSTSLKEKIVATAKKHFTDIASVFKEAVVDTAKKTYDKAMEEALKAADEKLSTTIGGGIQ